MMESNRHPPTLVRTFLLGRKVMFAFRLLKYVAAALLVTLGLAISSCGGGGGGGGSSGPSVPAISTISPVGTSAGNAAFTLNVLGSGFSPSSTVQWNGVNRTTH